MRYCRVTICLRDSHYASGWLQVRFRIVPKFNSDGLPLAHTCFFLIELPMYKSLEQMRAVGCFER